MPRKARSVVPLRSVARPKQARSERTLLRLLDAAEALIAERGLAGVSIPDIARRADSSVGGFYARFSDRDELLRALEERFFERVSKRVESLVEPARWAVAPLNAIVAVAVRELVQITGEHRNLIAAFVARAAQDPGIRQRGLRFRESVASKVTPLLLSRSAEMSHPNPALAIDLAIQVAFAVMLQRAIFASLQADGHELSDAEIEGELSRVFLTYVGALPEARATQSTLSPPEETRP